MKIIEVNDCQDCPYYERYAGKSSVYHTCRHSCKTVKEDFSILWKFCELEEVEDE